MSIGTIGWIGYSGADESLESEAFGKLAGVQSNKSNAVKDDFGGIRDQVVTTSENDQTARAMREFRVAFEALDERDAVPAGDGEAAVRSYYEEVFIPRLEEGSGKEGKAEDYFPEQGHIQYLQNEYIASNPTRSARRIGSIDQVEEIADSAADLDALTETLRKSVQRFRIEEEPMAGKEPSPQEPVPVAAMSRQ